MVVAGGWAGGQVTCAVNFVKSQLWKCVWLEV
jgi:hypothetical protein